jgi:hypothetical protein
MSYALVTTLTENFYTNIMKITYHQLLPSVALLTILMSCQSQIEYIPNIRVATSVANSYTASGTSVALSSLGYAVTPVELNPTEIMVAVGVKEKEKETGRIKSLGELVFSTASDGQYKSTRIAGGGRYYVGSDPTIKYMPFFSLYSVIDAIESDLGDIGSQLGLSLGGGVEYALSEKAFFDMSFNYLIPLLGAETVINNPSVGAYDVTTELDGWSINMGIGTSF